MLPLTTPIKGVDGKMITEVLVPAGTIAHVGLKAANLDRNVFGPDALEWNPDRWLQPLPKSLTEAQIPGVYTKLCVLFIPLRLQALAYKI